LINAGTKYRILIPAARYERPGFQDHEVSIPDRDEKSSLSRGIENGSSMPRLLWQRHHIGTAFFTHLKI
jgi:hypothetical protein